MNYLLTVLPNYYFIRHLNFIIADWYTLIFPHQLCSSIASSMMQYFKQRTGRCAHTENV